MIDPDIKIAVIVCAVMFAVGVARSVFVRRRRPHLPAGRAAFTGPLAGSVPIAALGIFLLALGVLQKCPPENIVCDGPMMLVAAGIMVIVLAIATHLLAMIVAFAIIRD